MFGKMGARGGFGGLGRIGGHVASGGGGAAVDLNFATASYVGGSLASMLANTNSTGGYVTNSDGSITLVAANTLRIGTGTGLLVEESRTNAIFQSQGFSNGSVWGKPNVTVVDNAVISPDGTVDASTIIPTVTSATHVVSQNISTAAVANQFHTYSFYVKKNGYNFAYISVSDNTIDSMTGFFDLNLGTVLGTNNGSSASWTSISATITPAANGFFRITLTGKDTPGSTIFSAFLGVNSATGTTAQSFVGDTVSGVIAYGAQAEIAQSFATSYIPTTTAAVTRSADNIAVSGALATLLARSTATIVANTNNSQQSLAGTLLDANGVVLLGKTAGNVGTTAVGAALSTGNTGPWTGANDLGFAWDATGGALQLNGGTIATDATARTPAATFHIGSTGGSSAFFDGYFTRLTGYNTKQASPQ